MKIALTLLMQKEIEAANDGDADAKITAIKQQFERQGWTVSVEDDSEVGGEEEDEGEEGEEEEDGEEE